MRRLLLLLPVACLAQGEALFDDVAPAEEPAAPAPAPFSEWDGVTQLFPDPSGKGFGEGQGPSPSLELVGEFPLPDSAPEGLSGIAWQGNTPGLEALWDDLYALVEDSGGRLHSATIGIDRETGAITNAVVSPAGAIPGATDLESIASGIVPVKDGTLPMLFASDEHGPAIWANCSFDTSGQEWASLSLPSPLRRCRFNRALESLALSADGRILWTANEGPLPEDGPEPTTERGARVRLYALDVERLVRGRADESLASSTQAPEATPTEPAFWFYELDSATGGKFPHLPDPFNGLSELCALPDGRLLALERSYGVRTRSADDPRASLITISIYLVDPLSSAARTAAAERPPVLAKTLLWRGLSGRANYEGMTLGPELADGSRALLLVSDGDVTRKGAFAFPWSKRLLSLRLRPPAPAP